MRKRILDACILITYWKHQDKRLPRSSTPNDARGWAEKLIQLYDTNAIVTPVYVEFIVGVTSTREMQLSQAYLDRFTIVDKGNISKQDWEETKRLAQRVPADGKRRQLGDCLIRAIANRLGYDVSTMDKRFAR